MAFTSKLKKVDIQGTQNVRIYELNFDGVTAGDLKTGLGEISFASINNETTAAKGLLKKNTASDGAAVERGSINLSGFEDGDKATLIVFGN